MILPKIPNCGNDLAQLTSNELEQLVAGGQLDSYLEREATKIIDLRIWNKRHTEQLAFIKMVLEKREYIHNIHDVETFNSTTGKIVYSDGQSTTECFLTDNHITFKDLDLDIGIDQFSLWLDS